MHRKVQRTVAVPRATGIRNCLYGRTCQEVQRTSTRHCLYGRTYNTLSLTNSQGFHITKQVAHMFRYCENPTILGTYHIKATTRVEGLMGQTETIQAPDICRLIEQIHHNDI